MKKLKVRYIGDSDPLQLLNGNIYTILSIENSWYRIVDETGDDYLYLSQLFQILDDDEKL